MIEKYITVSKNCDIQIGMDIGTQDPGVAMQELDKVLTSYKIPHKFETHEGTHVSRIGGRRERKALLFFSNTKRAGARVRGTILNGVTVPWRVAGYFRSGLAG